jgi:2OG-Fe(II) oxygenase superfamily
MRTHHQRIPVITVSKQFKITHEDHKTVARKGAISIVQDCKALAQQQLQQIDAVADNVLAELASCMEAQVAAQLKSVAEDIAFSATTRKKMAGFFENYTCADDDLPSSESKENTTWYDNRREMELDVSIMLDRPASRIHVVEEFITEEECKAMEEAAAPQLHRAVVANGAGGHEVSENRKAMQAGIKVPWNEEDQAHPIATISRRVYDYTNHVLKLDIDEHGQEDLMSIQYFGRGSNETKPDQYMPHCDGECTGDPHKYGNRMATMVMYCTMPSKGGATNFRNSGLHVRAKKGSAVFFSYIDPETKIMDSGFTEHSGCPVVEGEKKIVTQWVRYGVTSEVPWTAYNSLGILVKDAVDQD